MAEKILNVGECHKKAEKWILDNQDACSLSTWCDVAEDGKIVGCVSHGCHASFGYTFASLKKPCVVHGEKFCNWKHLDEAGQRYFNWLCDNKKSLFAKWADKGMKLVKNDKDKIVGALWTNMKAPQYVVGQWMFAGRCVGEHNRATSWDHMVQNDLDPTFAFWAMHFFSLNRGRDKNRVFTPSKVAHIGITTDNTLPRVYTKNPRFEAPGRYHSGEVGPFGTHGRDAIYSNFIWVHGNQGYAKMFPSKRAQSSSFGAIEVEALDIQCLKDGLKKIEDSGAFEIKGDD